MGRVKHPVAVTSGLGAVVTYCFDQWLSGVMPETLQQVPWGWITLCLLALFLGTQANQFENGEHWSQRKVRTFRRIFEIHSRVFAGLVDNNVEREVLRVQLRFAKSAKAAISVRIVSNLGWPWQDQFILHGDWDERPVWREKDEIVSLDLAVFPLVAHDDAPPGYNSWGSVLRRTGDLEGVRHVPHGSSMIEISARTWRGVQTERLLFVWPPEGVQDHGKAMFRDGEIVTLMEPEKSDDYIIGLG